MTRHSPYVQEQAAALRERMGELRDEVREAILAGAGFPVEPGSVRVRRRELAAAVTNACRDALPRDAAGVAAVVAREPQWLESETDPDSPSMSLVECLHREMADGMVSELSGDIHVAVLKQYEGATFGSVVAEIRAVIQSAGYVGKGAQEALATACDVQESKDVPNTRALLRPMDKMREALAHAGKAGDRPRLVQARILMELTDFIDATGYALDVTHVPAGGPRP